MVATAFQTNTETGLAAMAADLLAAHSEFDDSDDPATNENVQMLVLAWAMVKGIRSRQHAAATAFTHAEVFAVNGVPTTPNPNADRIFEILGGHSMAAFLPLMTMIDDVYNEFLTVFGVDDVGDDLWGTNLVTNGSGPQLGPLMGDVKTPGFST